MRSINHSLKTGELKRYDICIYLYTEKGQHFCKTNCSYCHTDIKLIEWKNHITTDNWKELRKQKKIF